MTERTLHSNEPDGSGSGSHGPGAPASSLGFRLSLAAGLFLLSVSGTTSYAQEGPSVPCSGLTCEDALHKPWPESGSWYNPEQSGSGLTVEIQNGVLLAYYFGYNEEGKPEWQMLSGPLQPGESEGVIWQIEVAPLRVSGGNCLGCAYLPPESFEARPPIRLEFLQRAHARITPQGSPSQYFVPLVYGSVGNAYFAEQTPYKFPALTDEPFPSLWSLTVSFADEYPLGFWTWISGTVVIENAQTPTDGEFAGKLVYSMYLPLGEDQSEPFGRIVCGTDVTGPELGCQLESFTLTPALYDLSVGNFTDDRIFAQAEDGTRIEVFRLRYD